MIELYDNLMELCATCDKSKFFFKDFTGPLGGKFRVFSYHYASYSDWLIDGALESRGIMFEMDEDGPVRIASRPMEKFFNLDENPLVMNLNLTEIAYAMDKADGSLVSSYVDDGYLYLKSKTSLYSEQARWASALLNSPEYDVLRTEVQNLTEAGLTVNFEFVSPNNRIVLEYQEPRLIVLNVRANSTGEYADWSDLFANPRIRPWLVNAYPVEDSTTWVNSVRETEGIEGYVAVMESGQRFKVKTKWYSALHHTKDSITSNEKLYASVVASASDDLRGMFAGDTYAISKINAFETIYLKFLSESMEMCLAFYEEWRGKDRKAYAMAATKAAGQQKYLFGVLMNLYPGTHDIDKLMKDLEKVFLKNWSLFVPKEYSKEIELISE